MYAGVDYAHKLIWVGLYRNLVFDMSKSKIDHLVQDEHD